MSGSDEEASFASADEGESPPVQEPPKDKESATTKSKESPAKKDQKKGPKKGKGKGSGQTSPRKDPEEKKPATSPKGKKNAKKHQTPKTEKPPADDPEKNVPEDTDLKKVESAEIEKLDEKVPDKAVPSGDSGDKAKSTKSEMEGSDAGEIKDTPSPPAASSPQAQSIPREKTEDTQTPQKEKIPDEPVQKGSGGGWGWSNWGSSLLTAASSSVTTFTNQVGDGINTIMDSVESSLGVPEPSELRAEHLREERRLAESVKEGGDNAGAPITDQPEEMKDKTSQETKSSVDTETADGSSQKDGSWFSSWGVADLAKKVQEKGKNLATKGSNLMAEGFDAVENIAAGGIDVLENIGKKTYNTLSEHDHNLRKTREFLSPKKNKPNLSGILREAKDRAEQEAEQEKENEEARKAHFGTLFDDFQGIAHLEALEMLSNQSEKKVHSLLNSLSADDLVDFKPQLIAIKEKFEINDVDDDETEDQDFTSLVSEHISELELGTTPDKLKQVHDMVKQWISDFDDNDNQQAESLKSVHQRSIQSLAELTSKGVEQFHKAGERVLLDKEKDKDCTDIALNLAKLTGVLCHEVGNLSSKFADCLNQMADKEEKGDEVTALVTNVYLEATNSSTYLQDAFQLLLPVLQHAALEHAINSRSQS